jgi:uroporphyrinogen-III synthase
MTRVVVLRPEPGNAATCTAARALGLDPYAAPLFATGPVGWQCPAPPPPDGLLIGSAAVFAHGGDALTALRAVPVHAVGATTARAAHAAGFTVATTGSGGLQAVVDTLPAGQYLRLAGEAHVPLTLPAGVSVETIVVYAARPLALNDDAATLIAREPVVALLHSAEAARHFAAECDRLNLARDHIALACLGPRIVPAAGPGWRTVHVAATPDDQAVLFLARQMCQTV